MGEIQEVIGYPPNYDALRVVFDINPSMTIFTYGNKIYNPGAITITKYLMAHEIVHMIQQEWNDDTAAIWWSKYMRDPAFRLDQEARAYAIQLREMVKGKKGEKYKAMILTSLATDLASGTYGKCATYPEASALIMHHYNATP